MATDPRRCAINRELISSLLDGELAFDERAQLMNHLAGCPECRALLDGYRAIGTQLRALPAAQAPQELRADIYAATIDAEPRRLFFLTSKLGYSMAALAAAALLFVVAGYLLIGGYQRGVTPQINTAQPIEGSVWPVNKPVEITFNKPMDHASVENALAIQPDGEEARLDISWHGNTLVIGETTPLRAGSKYELHITTAARDKWGHRLESDFALSFGTAPSFAVADTPTPDATTAPPASPVPSATGTEAVAVTATSVPAGATATGVPVAPTATAPTTGPGVGPTQPSGSGDVPTPTTAPEPGDEPTATATELPVEIEPTATPTPEPTETPLPADPSTPTEAAPTPTATVAPATETPVVPTETPSTIGVTGVLGSVYWANESVRERLGDPLDVATSSTNQILGFTHGNMYLRSDTNDIYVMVLGVGWDRFTNTATTDPPFTAAPDPTFWIPGGAFGVLWSSEPSVQDSLGYALSSSATTFNGDFQPFTGGVMLSTPTDVLIFYNDGTWDFMPVINSSGDGEAAQ